MAIVNKFTATLPSPTATHVDGFVFLLSTQWFIDAANAVDAVGSPIDGGAKSLANGGGDMQAYADADTTTQLPLHVVEFVTGGSPSALVRLRRDSWTAGDTITIAKDDAQTVQPLPSSTYGQYNVYPTTDRAHLGGDLKVDISGNITDGVFNGTESTGSDAVGEYTLFNGSNNYISQQAIGTKTSLTISAQIAADDLSADGYVFAHGDFASTSRLYFGLDSSEQFYTRIGATAKTSSAVSGVAIVAAVISGGAVTHFVNGVQIGVASAYSGNAGSSLSGATAIGAFLNAGSSNSYYKGKLYSLFIDDATKSAAKLADEYANQSDPDNFATIGAWVDAGAPPTAPFPWWLFQEED